MSKKEKIIALYKKVFDTEKEPNIMEVIQLFNLMSKCLCHPDAKKELGDDVYNVIKKCTKVGKRSTKVDVTAIVRELEWDVEQYLK